MASVDNGLTLLEIGTLGIAIYAAGVSTATLLSQRRCKLVVTSGMERRFAPGVELAYQLRVTNVGSRPVSVVGYSWEGGGGGPFPARALQAQTDTPAFSSSRLPTLLAEGEVAEYYFDLEKMQSRAAWTFGHIVVRDARGRIWAAPFDEDFRNDARKHVE